MFSESWQSRKGLSVVLSSFLVVGMVWGVQAGNAGGASPSVQIDLDRGQAGVQSQLLGFANGGTVQGAVVVTGQSTVTVNDYAVEIQFARQQAGDAINCAGTTFGAGEITSAFGAQLCQNPFIRKSNLFVNPGVAVGEDGILVLFTFDVVVNVNDGESVTLSLQSTANNPQLGITINGVPRTFGAGTSNPIDTAIATIRGGGGVTPVPTCDDAGYYVLDAFGGRHHVGNPVAILGSLYYGRDVAEDMELIQSTSTIMKNIVLGPVADIAVLDTFGAVQFVANPSGAPGQTFYFPEGSSPAAGFAVDVEVSNDSLGFWVLTERGGIYRAGSALPGGESAQLGNAAADLTSVLGIPFGGATPRDPGLPSGDSASIRAVGFVVLQGGFAATPQGYVVLDSQGGHYTYDAAGNVLSDGVQGSVLNGATAYPFFAGLDIARDIELALNTNVSKGILPGGPLDGLVIYDGWGGVHPVPVTDTPNSLVGFLRNEGLTTVGLPYLKVGFDDPATEGVNEGDANTVGFDVGSIFKDIEFCSAGGPGVYVLDGFGGVFTFGSTRPSPDSPTTMFTGSPYFFPNILARDLEATFLTNLEK